ncbi:2Fe-2S iron-sulfur cluster-binding protein [Novipirellula artificiosorum]|uniref:NAD-reducing hydrogenase HoxS subunit gamma n=1 Tax=Novipirellula artificiosorum TaxID=2528016 RepID=A0A5C6DDE0_9BACT|nr:2Fe-2S iron-sulfur cluster-binding protein [Novipirellula artificiosorum]TWU34265.1 NAD-reducing hydrogenase HoxS subunit gamma [Novipirellula artificiosorum]
MSDNTITFTIDGKEVQGVPGQKIMEAADAAGVYIPRLCHHKDLPPRGHCRLCVVKVDGRPKSSCTIPIEDGMQVENDTEELNEHRRMVLEMMFVEGNHFCPSCESSGNCELQAEGYRLGMITPTLPYIESHREMDATHPDIFVNRDLCILCGRCVRASAIQDGKTVFAFEGRGIHKVITVNAEHGLGETLMDVADAAASVCPTGCLHTKRLGYTIPVGQRKYDHRPIGSDIEQAAH